MVVMYDDMDQLLSDEHFPVDGHGHERATEQLVILRW